MKRFAEVVRVAVGSLLTHKMRSLLTLLGVIIGVATIITVVSAIAGLNLFVRQKIFTLSPDVFIVSKLGIITSRDDLLRAHRRKDLTVVEMERLHELCTSCRDVGGTMQGSKTFRYGDRRLADVRITGSTANLADLFNLDIEEGRFFTDGEAWRSSPVVVIGSDVKDQLYPNVDPLGRIVTMDGYPLKVIGLLRRQGSVLGQSQDNVAWMPLKVYEKVFGHNRSVNIWVQAVSLETFDRSQDEVRTLIRRMRGTPFSAEDPFSMVNAAALQSLWKTISAAASAMMILIAGISLVVGGIVIMNIMLVSVVERTREIGVRTSLGARRRDILLQFLFESSILAAAGGVVGAVLGVGASHLVGGLSPFPTLVRPSLVVISLLLATGVGLVFGVWPSWKASRLNPVDALRSE